MGQTGKSKLFDLCIVSSSPLPLGHSQVTVHSAIHPTSCSNSTVTPPQKSQIPSLRHLFFFFATNLPSAIDRASMAIPSSGDSKELGHNGGNEGSDDDDDDEESGKSGEDAIPAEPKEMPLKRAEEPWSPSRWMLGPRAPARPLWRGARRAVGSSGSRNPLRRRWRKMRRRTLVMRHRRGVLCLTTAPTPDTTTRGPRL